MVSSMRRLALETMEASSIEESHGILFCETVFNEAWSTYFSFSNVVQDVNIKCMLHCERVILPKMPK